MKKYYSLLYFQQLDDKNSKWIFPLHNGENIIGSDKDVDIFLYLNNKEDFIDSVHAKIILKESTNEVKIINLATKGFVKKLYNLNKVNLSPGKEYQLSNKSVFYLSENSKFILVNGTIEEIKKYLTDENIEDEFHKWYQKIMDNKTQIKISLNLVRKESSGCNKSFLSNNNINNNDSFILNKNSSNFTPNALANRTGFNNFDEVPDILALTQISKKSFSEKYNKYFDNKNVISNINPFYIKEGNIDYDEANKNNEMNNDNYNNEENKTNINKIKIDNKESGFYNNNYDTNLENIFKPETIIEKYNNDQMCIKDENTVNLIKQLLGESNLEIIFRNTDINSVIKYDIFYKNLKNSKKIKGDINLNNNIDIQLKQNNIEEKIKKVKKKIHGKK